METRAAAAKIRHTQSPGHHIRMPNRAIYLPDELDQVSRRIGLNLSQLRQKAIRQYMTEHSDESLDARTDAASARTAALDLEWPSSWLAREWSGARER